MNEKNKIVADSGNTITFSRVGEKETPHEVLTGGHTSCCQSVARWAGCPRGCSRPFYPQPIPLGQKAGGSKGATPPSPEVQEPGGSWRIFAYFLYARK